jgi:hypothetical protein
MASAPVPAETKPSSSKQNTFMTPSFASVSNTLYGKSNKTSTMSIPSTFDRSEIQFAHQFVNSSKCPDMKELAKDKGSLNTYFGFPTDCSPSTNRGSLHNFNDSSVCITTGGEDFGNCTLPSRSSNAMQRPLSAQQSHARVEGKFHTF